MCHLVITLFYCEQACAIATWEAGTPSANPYTLPYMWETESEDQL